MSPQSLILILISSIIFCGFAQTKTSDSNYITSIRLQGDSQLGYYYATLFFGTPIQKQTLIVDTGSVTTTIPCTECGTNCGTHHFDGPFKHDNSTSFQTFKCDDTFGNYVCSDCTSSPCGFNVAYVEGSSYNGHFTRDFVTFGNEIEDYYTSLMAKQGSDSASNRGDTIDHDVSTEEENKAQAHKEYVDSLAEKRKIKMPFGCTDRETKLFFDQEADGILGLGVDTNSRNNPPNIVDAIQLSHGSASRAFSICFAPEGGYLTFGGYNTEHHQKKDNIHYVSYSTEFNQYKVFLKDISMEGSSLGLATDTLNHGEGAFFDSGTTLTHVPTATYNSIVSHMTQYCESNSKHCGKNNKVSNRLCWISDPEHYPTEEDFLKTFPSFTFSFGHDGKAKYTWKPEDYMYQKSEANQYCMGLSRYDRETILGGTFMKNHDILFDKENNKIGFIRANCAALNGPTDYSPTENGEGAAEKDKEQVTQDTKEPIATEIPVTSIDEYMVTPKGSILAYIVIFLVVITGVNLVVYLIKKWRQARKYINMGRDLELAKSKNPETSFQGPASGRTEGLATDHGKTENEVVIQSVVEI